MFPPVDNTWLHSFSRHAIAGTRFDRQGPLVPDIHSDRPPDAAAAGEREAAVAAHEDIVRIAVHRNARPILPRHRRIRCAGQYRWCPLLPVGFRWHWPPHRRPTAASPGRHRSHSASNPPRRSGPNSPRPRPTPTHHPGLGDHRRTWKGEIGRGRSVRRGQRNTEGSRCGRKVPECSL